METFLLLFTILCCQPAAGFVLSSGDRQRAIDSSSRPTLSPSASNDVSNRPSPTPYISLRTGASTPVQPSLSASAASSTPLSDPRPHSKASASPTPFTSSSISSSATPRGDTASAAATSSVPSGGASDARWIVFSGGKDSLNSSLHPAILAEVPGYVDKHFDNVNGMRLKADTPQDVLDKFSAQRGVKLTRDTRIKFLGAQTQSDASWALARISRSKKLEVVGSGDVQYGAHYAYAYNDEEVGKDVDIYVVDSGVMCKLDEFGQRATCDNAAVFTDERDPSKTSEDPIGHGTGVASLAAGTKLGSSKEAKIVAIRVTDAQGMGWTSDVVLALSYVARQVRGNRGRRGVLLAALAGTSESYIGDAFHKSIVDNGVVLVAAAGNDAKDACEQGMPHSMPEAIVVGGTDIEDKMDSQSNTGPCVALFAPSKEVLALNKDGGTSLVTGTSFSAGLVAGVVANYLSRTGQSVWSARSIKPWLQFFAVSGAIQGVPDNTYNYLVQSQVPAAKISLTNDDEGDANGGANDKEDKEDERDGGRDDDSEDTEDFKSSSDDSDSDSTGSPSPSSSVHRRPGSDGGSIEGSTPQATPTPTTSPENTGGGD
ncbi:Suppressor of the cold-sensitive snRNP bioproteinsis mutant brr1-1 [Savitreella phatthalungensis]